MSGNRSLRGLNGPATFRRLLQVPDAGADGVLRDVCDGEGDALPLRVSTTIAEVTAFPSTPNSITNRAWVEARIAVNLLDFVPASEHAAIMDGTSTFDAGPALRQLRDAVAGNKRDAMLPPGRIFLGSPDPLAPTFALVLNNISGFRMRGAGKGATTLFVGPGLSIGGINLTSSSDIELCDFDIDGNWPNQTTFASWHGVRGAVLERVALRRMNIIRAAGYGVGFQVGGSPSRSDFRDLVLEDIHITEAAVDGLDIKNRGDLNEDVRLTRVVVRDPGRGEPLLSKAGLDVRGPCTLTDCAVWFTQADAATSHIGIRVRQSASSATNGIGGAKTIIKGCRVRATAPGNLVLGISVGNPHVVVSGCIVEGVGARAFDGVPGGDYVQWTGNQAVDCVVGIRLSEVTGNQIIGFRGIGATQENIRLQDAIDTQITNASAVGGTYGVRHVDDTTTTTGTRLIGCFFTGASISNYAMAVGTFEYIACAGMLNDLMLQVGDEKALELGHRPAAVNYARIYPGDTGAGVSLTTEGADPNVSWMIASKGTGSISLRGGGGTLEAVRILPVVDAVNYAQIRAAAAGSGPSFGADGADADIPVEIRSQGAGVVTLRTHAGASEAMRVIGVPSAVNRVNLTPGATGSPVTLAAVGSDTDVALQLVAQAGGSVRLGSATNQIGFFGVAGTTRGALPPAATDLASALTLVNAIRSRLIAHGLTT
jgi:hypothetical protein